MEEGQQVWADSESGPDLTEHWRWVRLHAVLTDTPARQSYDYIYLINQRGTIWPHLRLWLIRWTWIRRRGLLHTCSWWVHLCIYTVLLVAPWTWTVAVCNVRHSPLAVDPASGGVYRVVISTRSTCFKCYSSKAPSHTSMSMETPLFLIVHCYQLTCCLWYWLCCCFHVTTCDQRFAFPSFLRRPFFTLLVTFVHMMPLLSLKYVYL